VAGRDVPRPKPLKLVTPAFTASSRLEESHGLVFVEATIDVTGSVRDVQIAGSLPSHDRAVRDAVRQWQFTPVTVNDRLVSVAITLFVRVGTASNAAVEAIDAARFFAERSYDDARSWATQAATLVAEEAKVRPAAPAFAVRVLPFKVQHVPPTMPVSAKAVRIDATVVIDAVVAADGSVRDARVVSGDRMVNEEALNTVRRWRYLPASEDSRPVDYPMTFTVSFKAF
jgi:TonB family protein